MLSNLMQNPIAWLILSTITIASLIIGIIGIFKSKETKEFSFNKFSNSVYKSGKNEIPNLKVLYNDKSIDDVSITKIVIWCSGKSTINKKDIVNSKELAVFSKNDSVSFLSADIIESNEVTNNFKIVKNDEKRIILDFEYVEKGNGIVIQLVHTGNPRDINVDCKIKGGKKIKGPSPSKSNLKNEYRYKKIVKKAIIILPFVYFALLFVAGVLGILELKEIIPRSLVVSSQNIEQHYIINIIAFLTCSIIMLAMGLIMVREDSHLNIPSSLRDSIDPNNNE